MAMRCFGRERLVGATTRPLLLIFFRAVGLPLVLALVLALFLALVSAAALRAGDFFSAAVLVAAREPDVLLDVLLDVFFGFLLCVLAIGVLPFRFLSERLAQFALCGCDQCSRKTPSTARSSAGLISLECATVTENNGPSSFSSQKARKSFSAGKFGNIS